MSFLLTQSHKHTCTTALLLYSHCSALIFIYHTQTGTVGQCDTLTHDGTREQSADLPVRGQVTLRADTRPLTCKRSQ